MNVSDELLNAGQNVSMPGQPGDEELMEMYNKFLQTNPEQAKELDESLKGLQEKVLPTPGCCLKTKNLENNEKVFINVCTSSSVPAPRDITERELQQLVESIEDSDAIVDYRVPMSIGEAHAELDKQDKGCSVYDVIINPAYLEKIRGSGVFLGFFMSIVIEGIFNKHSIELDRNWILLKRKTFAGSLQEQYMRTKRLIQEMPGTTTSVSTPGAEKPKFTIQKEPPSGHPQYLIAEVNLSKISRAKAISLDVGEDRIVLTAKPYLYELDIFLPYKLVQAECGSQFNVKTKVLTVTMPVQPL